MKRFQRGLAILLSACMIGGMMPLPASAEESVSGNTVQTESTEQVQENGEAGTGGLNKENKQPGTEEAPSEDEKSSETDNETGSETESETVTDAETEDTAISAVQALIDTLPDADSITEDRVEEVTAQLDAIDEAKAELTEEEMSQLDLTRYDAAINKVMALMGIKEENDSEIAVQANDSAGKTEQQSTDEASVTINGTTLYYATLEEAFSAADRKTATINMLNDAECTVTSGSPISVNKSNITLNMNGKTLSGHGTGDCGIITLGTGSLSVQGPGTMKSTYMCLSCQSKNAKMTVENITFDVSEADYGVWVVSSNTVTLNNIQIIGKAKTAAVYQYSKSANVTINNMNAIDGGYSDVCFKGNTLKINGGTFDKISVNSYYVASITSVSQVLGEGCIYRNNEDKTWVTSELSNTLEISNVTVEKIPLTMNPEAETSWYYNSAEHSLQMNAEPTTAGNDITYEWYDGDTKLECDSDTYTVPKTMPIGSYTYTCKATCDGYTLSHEFTFTVEECKHENVEITFNSNGFGNCPKCNATVYQPAVETNDKYDIDDDGTKDTVYEIGNAGQLYWFADKVNNDNATYGSANAVLTADIVVNENLLDSLNYDADGNVTNGERFIGWTRIGWSEWVGEEFLSNPYTGTFDGQNHTVSGLYFNDAGKNNVGLFGDVGEDGSVSNVGVVDSCFYCYGDVGGVCGSSYGTISNCYNTGRVSGNDANVGGVCGSSDGTITNCYNTGAVSSNSSCVGGVCGDNMQDGKISNCYNTGTVSGATAVGGVSGRNYNIITNCYNVGTVCATGNNPNVGGVCGYCWGSETIESYCYYLDTCAADGTTFNINRGKSKTASQFASGEVTYALNQENGTAAGAEEPVWKQTLEGDSKDAAPTLKSTAGVVYQYTRLRCDGQTKTEDNVAYTNDSAKNGTSIKDEHKYEINTGDHAHHKCSVCGETAYTYERVENTTDTIKATCSVCRDTYTVRLLAPTSESGTLTYDGTAKAATTSIIAGFLGETLTVTYATLTDGTESAYSEDAPKNSGSYRAKLALGSGENAVSVTVDYTIAKATPTIAWSEGQKNQSVIYTGNEVDVSKITAPTVTLLSDDTFSDSSKITYSYRKVTDGKASGDFISGLPADIGTYEIKATILAEGNYTAAETADTMQLTIAYLASAPDAVVTDKNNKTYNSDAWCPSDIVLKAPDGYKISMEVKGDYEASCTYTGSKENETITYYLKADKSGEIAEKSVTVKMDWTAPDFSSESSGINIKMNWWNSLLSTITFGLYKGSLDVNIKADDSQSGVAEYYYYIDNSGSTTTLTAEELGTKTFTKVDADKNGTTKLTEITSDNNYVIYAYAVDAASNRSIYISSDGVVLDNTAPKLTDVSVPAKSNETLSDTSATITFTGSEAGTYYYILKEDGKPAPTVMSDFAAKTAGDKVDTWTAKEGVSTGTLTADEANTIKLTGLKANTGYVLYLAATDAAGNASVAESAGADADSGVVSVSFTTTKTTPYVKTAPVLSGTYGNTVSAMLKKADKTKAVVTAGRNSDTKVEGTWTLASEDADKLPTVGTSEKYTLVFTPAGSDADTYDSVTCEVTPVVSKKQITVVIADKEKFYGETNPALTWSLATGDAYLDNVLVADDTEEALGISLSTTAKDDSKAGTYAITGISDSTSYEVFFTGSVSDGKNGILTVKQAANSFTTKLSCSGYTYAKDETPKPNATAKFGTVTYKYATANSDGKAPKADSAYTDAIPVNAGIYAVKAYVAETDNYAGLASDPVVFTIGKAAEPTIAGEEKSYAYSAGSDGKTIGVDIAGKLPTDRGTTAYALTNTYNEQLLSDVAVDQDGNLTYKVKEADKSQVGATATITVTASMENYEDAVYTMTIKITDKKLVTLKSGNTVSVNGSNALTYGDKLSKLGFSDVTFVDADTNTEVKGTLEWADPDCMPTAGTTQAGWVFKPADSKHYEELTGTAAITVVRATPAVVTVPTVAEREYNPAVALADSDMTGGSVTGADGNELAGTWSFTGTIIIPTVNNKGYQAVFTPDDTNNYSTVTRTITVKVTKATPVIAEKPTAGALIYGQKLSDSKLTGGKAAYQTADGTEITGTFAWKNSSSRPTAADSQKTEYDVTFTPSDKDNYNAVDTKLTITVNKAAQAPNMPQAEMAPAHSTKKVGDITLPDGWTWQEDDKDTALADGVAVTANAIYTGTDKGNYETESVSITITRSECEHKNTEIINKKDATCSVEGYTGDTFCKDCGKTLASGTTIEKKPHMVGTSATCVSKAVCSVCGEAFGEVDANNHVHTTVKNQKKATCTQTGYTGDTYCTDCDKLLGMGKELAALGHDYKATVTKQPTTTEEGIRTYTCTRCNSSYTESIAKLPEEQHTHNYTGSITKEATCTEAGVRTYTCSCGDSYTENIPATGHSYVSKVTKAATTTEEGIMTYTCSKCGHSYTQPIAMIKSDDSSKDNGSQNQKPQTGTDNGNQNQKPQTDTDNGKDNGTSIKPYIKDDSGKEGWDVIKPQLEEAKSGDTVTVAMNGTTVVPKDVIDSIKGKDTTLVLDMGNGLSWKIFGKDITDAAGDIDFGVTVGADAGKSIPVDVINNVTGERSSLNLTLAYDGEFGFTATLTVNMESKNAGLYANLFYYNEQTGELEFISAGQIDPDGNVELEFTHASDYTIVVDAKIMSDNGQADNKSDETIPASKTDDSTSKYAWNNTIIIIIGICIILIVFGAVFYVRKKSGSEEE